MVDVRAVNEKLVKRSEDMLIQLTGRSRDDVRNALSRANGSVKIAVMLLHGCDLESAKHLLSAAGDRLGAALDRVGNASQQGLDTWPEVGACKCVKYRISASGRFC